MIVDLPPVLLSDDAITLAPQLDAVILVVAGGAHPSRGRGPRSGAARQYPCHRHGAQSLLGIRNARLLKCQAHVRREILRIEGKAVRGVARSAIPVSEPAPSPYPDPCWTMPSPSPRASMLVTGDVGCGKTTVIRHFLNRSGAGFSVEAPVEHAREPGTAAAVDRGGAGPGYRYGHDRGVLPTFSRARQARVCRRSPHSPGRR